MVTVRVNPGICGLNSIVKIHSDDMQHALIDIVSDCPSIKSMEQDLKEVDGFEECFSKLGASKVAETAKKYCKHTACPVPCAILKGIEVACGLALPKDVEIKIEKD